MKRPQLNEAGIPNILQMLPVGVTVQDRSGKLIYSNELAAKIIGFNTVEELLNATLEDILGKFIIFDEESKMITHEELPGRIALRTHVYQERIVKFQIKASGKYHWSKIQAQPLLENGELKVVINTFQDLTSFKETESKLNVLTNLGTNMATSLDYERRLKELAHLIVPSIADWCAIDIVDIEGYVRRLIVAHPEKNLVELAKYFSKKYPPDINSNTGLYQVIRSGKSEFYPIIDDKMIKATVNDPVQYKIIKKLKIDSMAIVPLIARGKTLGAISFVGSLPRHPYTNNDLHFFESIARKAALLADNARLYEVMRRENQKQKELHTILEENEKTLWLALDVGKMRVWDWDIRDGQLKKTTNKNITSRVSQQHITSFEQFLKSVDHLDRKRVQNNIEKAIQQVNKFEIEYRVKGDDPKHSWYIAKGEVLPNNQGDPSRLIGICMDITKRKIDEVILTQSEKKFRSIFDSSLDIMFVVNNKQLVVDSNQAFTAYFGINKSELEKMTIFKLFSGNTKQMLQNIWKDMQKTGTNHGEINFLRNDGAQRTLEYNCVANIMQGKHLFVMRDVSDRIIEEKRRDHFVGIASHELKSPLASIKALVGLSSKRLSGKGVEKVEYYVKTIGDKVDLLTRLINDLMDVTKIRQDKLDFFYELFSIDELITEVVDDMRLIFGSHTIIKTLGAKNEIVGDRIRIMQVIKNILKNAIKYSPTGSRIYIKSWNDNKEVWVSIKDSGPGIPRSERKKIFDLYYRGEQNDRSVQGLGVGLFIAAQIVKRHGGEITARTRVNGGAEFAFSLPHMPRKQNSKTIL